jgi:hypothetical protein
MIEDTPELEAHRNGIGGSVKSGAEWIPTAVGVALLRMVDELHAQRDAYVSASTRFCAERDELRAKLAEAEYQLAEEKNASANERDPSYHEERLTQENAILKRALAAALEGAAR